MNAARVYHVKEFYSCDAHNYGWLVPFTEMRNIWNTSEAKIKLINNVIRIAASADDRRGLVCVAIVGYVAFS